MDKKYYIFCLCSLILTFIIINQSYSQNSFNFEYDYCVFKNDDTSSFIELYYSFYQNDLKFIKTEIGYEADGFIELKILPDPLGKTVIEQSYKTPLFIKDTAAYNRKSKLLGQINIILKKADYYFVLQASDFNDTSKYVVIKDSIIANGQHPNSVQSSSLQLASQIEKSVDKTNVFYKNQLEVIPNPSKVFGSNMSDVYYYIEFYNLSKNNITELYSIVKTITDLNNNEIRKGKNEYKLKSDSRVEHGVFNVSDMNTGKYNFNVLLLDVNGIELLKQNNYFWVYNNSDTSSVYNEDPDNSYLLSEYKNYTDLQIQSEVDQIPYILPERYKEEFEKTKDIETKRKLLYEFWKKVDPNSGTAVNEFKVAYFERIKYANKNFKSTFADGWKTDRGRIYCVYDVPNDVERFPFEPNQKAYEIWRYDQFEGGVEFVFIDLSGNGENYVLVHSTAQRELRDDNWKNRLRLR